MCSRVYHHGPPKLGRDTYMSRPPGIGYHRRPVANGHIGNPDEALSMSTVGSVNSKALSTRYSVPLVGPMDGPRPGFLSSNGLRSTRRWRCPGFRCSWQKCSSGVHHLSSLFLHWLGLGRRLYGRRPTDSLALSQGRRTVDALRVPSYSPRPSEGPTCRAISLIWEITRLHGQDHNLRPGWRSSSLALG